MALTLRPIDPDDQDFLLTVYAGTRAAALASLPWDAAQKAALIHSQFHAQHAYYQAHYHGADFGLILLDDRPVGRLYVARWNDEIRLVDIALLPAYRGRGIGSALVQTLLAEAVQAGKPVRLHVEKHNPALRWYERLGFRRRADRGGYWFLEWSPPGPQGTSAS